MSGPRTRSRGFGLSERHAERLHLWEASEGTGLQLRDFVKSQGGQGMNVLVHGKGRDVAELYDCVAHDFNRQAIDFTDKLCALTALEISFRPICAELGLAAPSKGVLLDAFLTSRDFRPATRKFVNSADGDPSLGDPKIDRKREGFLTINTIRIVLHLISRTYATHFRLGLCRPREDGLNFDVTVFEPLVDESTRKISKTRTVWLYKNGLAQDQGLGWEGIAPDNCKPTSVDSTSANQGESEEVYDDAPPSPTPSLKRRRPSDGEFTVSKKARASPTIPSEPEPVSRFTRSRKSNKPEQRRSRPSPLKRGAIKAGYYYPPSPPNSRGPSSEKDDERIAANQSSSVDINYIRRSARAQKQPPWGEMSDISIEELLLWFPNHVLNWPGLALLVESKGWDQAHVAKFLFNNLVATMREEDQYAVKLNTVGSKLARAVKRIPGLEHYSFSTRASYKVQIAQSWHHLLLPPDGWKTEPAELWEFFIPPEAKEIRIPPELRGRPFSRRLYNAYCDRHGIARPFDDVPEPPVLQRDEPHPLLDSPDIDTESPIELGLKYIRENPQEWHGGTAALPLTVDARVPEDYDRRDIVRDFPHLLFGETFLYVHAEVSHRDIVQIWRTENEAYLKLQWPAGSETEMIKKAEAAVRKRKQIAIEVLARKEEGIEHRKDKPSNVTVQRIHQLFEIYKGSCGQKIRDIRSRLSRTELDEMQRERESRRINRRSSRDRINQPSASSRAQRYATRGSGRVARPFAEPHDDVLASDLLYSGPPVREPDPGAVVSAPIPDPYNGPAVANGEHAANAPNSRPMDAPNDGIPMNVDPANASWNLPNEYNFSLGSMDFGNLSFGSFDRVLRNSDPELSAIPQAGHHAINVTSAPDMPPAAPFDPNLIDPALLVDPSNEFSLIRPQGGFDPNTLLRANADAQLFYPSGRLPSTTPFSPTTHSSNIRVPSSAHRASIRSSTIGNGIGRGNSWDVFMHEIGTANAVDQAFDVFTTLNSESQQREEQKRKSSDRSVLPEYAWTAFAAMPGAMGMDGVDEEMDDVIM
ncbi:MAG: hypothetical protein M1822_001589 [Bathelium mastoideum]|nr:MAG: hypothetical protein M1822_001589 [Bathelium mastoideum]